MRFHKSDRVIKFAYGMQTYPPHKITLCALFWRLVLIAPLLWLALGSLLCLAGPVWCVHWCWKQTLGKVIKRWEEAADERRIARWSKGEALRPQIGIWVTIKAGFKAIKGRYCPIIEIKQG